MGCPEDAFPQGAGFFGLDFHPKRFGVFVRPKVFDALASRFDVFAGEGFGEAEDGDTGFSIFFIPALRRSQAFRDLVVQRLVDLDAAVTGR